MRQLFTFDGVIRRDLEQRGVGLYPVQVPHSPFHVSGTLIGGLYQRSDAHFSGIPKLRRDLDRAIVTLLSYRNRHGISLSSYYCETPPMICVPGLAFRRRDQVLTAAWSAWRWNPAGMTVAAGHLLLSSSRGHLGGYAWQSHFAAKESTQSCYRIEYLNEVR